MKDTAYLVLNSRGISRMTKKTRPKMARGEYAVRIELTVPDHVFLDRPIAQATLDVAVDKLVAPTVDVNQIEAPPAPAPAEPPAPPLEHDADYQAGRAEG